jgi:hypothetical protein
MPKYDPLKAANPAPELMAERSVIFEQNLLFILRVLIICTGTHLQVI